MPAVAPVQNMGIPQLIKPEQNPDRSQIISHIAKGIITAGSLAAASYLVYSLDSVYQAALLAGCFAGTMIPQRKENLQKSVGLSDIIPKLAETGFLMAFCKVAANIPIPDYPSGYLSFLPSRLLLPVYWVSSPVVNSFLVSEIRLM